MANPSAAQVATQHTIFVAAQGDQSTKKTAYDNEQEDVAEISVEGLDLVDDIWDECEFTFRKDSAPSKRRKCREYGVVYVPRAGETPSPDDFSMMGVITDGVTGNPIGNAVFVVSAATEIIVLTDGNGKFFVPVLPAGTYNIVAHKGGYYEYSATVVVVAGAITPRNVQLTPESVPDTGGISGTVSKGGVNILATVTVEGTTFTAQTNPLGVYLIEGVPPGSVMVRATSNSNPADTLVLPITVSAGGVIELIFNLP
ncbi:MAG: carboxypeptidase regulatory-like domain-containing protein [Bacteroidota bacterium]